MSEALKASTLAPFTQIWSFSRYITWISAAALARNTSPVPTTSMAGTPSPVIFDFRKPAAPPEPACSNRASPW